MKNLAYIALIAGIFYSSSTLHAKNSIQRDGCYQLSYGRINLMIESSDYEKVKDHKNVIDSIFSFTDQSLQQIELNIGYKITSDVEFMLTWDFKTYQELLQGTKFHAEQRGMASDKSTEKILPLYVVQSFHQIKTDIQFLVSYYLLDEFLHGVGVKQRLNQSDAVRLPLWFVNGYCLEFAEEWNAKDADEFHVYDSRNHYKNIHKIPAESQAVFGKYIWHNLSKYTNKNLASTIWYTVKYTNQLNEAFQFHFQKNFDDWYKELPPIQTSEKEFQSDLPFKSWFRDKVIRDYTANRNNDRIFWLSDELNDFIVLLNQQQEFVEIAKFTSLENTNPWRRQREILLLPTASNVDFSVICREGDLIVRRIISPKGNILKQDSQTLPLNFIHRGVNLSLLRILGDQSADFLRSVNHEVNTLLIGDKRINSDIHYALISMKSTDLPSKSANVTVNYYLGFYKISGNSWTTLRMDTATKPFVLGSFLDEGNNRVSYTTGKENHWKLNFIEFTETSDFQWNTGNTLRFFKHIRDQENRILEFGYCKRFPLAVIIENWNESKQDILQLYKQSFHAVDTTSKIDADTALAQGDSVPKFKFICGFPEHTWMHKVKMQVVRRYAGEFITKPFISSYYLKHAGVFLTNYENRDFAYINKIPVSNLINSPFTPLIRLHVSDKTNLHNIHIQMLSNIVGNRLGMEMQQSIKTRSLSEFFNSLSWRNRNFATAENNFIKNSAIYATIGYRESWNSHFKGTILGSFRYDAMFPRISNLSTAISAYQRLYASEFRIATEYSSIAQNAISNKRFNISLVASAGTAFFINEGMGNWDLRITGKMDKKIGRFLQYKNRLSARYSLGKVQTLYLLGGTDGWLADNQFISSIPQIKSETNFALLGFALPIRGVQYGSRLGSSFFGLQQQLEFDFFKSVIKRQIKNIFISDFIVYPFTDMGLAFIGHSPKDLSNPYNTKVVTTGNYRLWYSALHNPWIIAYGIGFKTYLMGFPIKYEIARPFMNKKFQRIQHLFGLQWEF